jgi:hypothetical protein
MSATAEGDHEIHDLTPAATDTIATLPTPEDAAAQPCRDFNPMRWEFRLL